MRVRGDCQCAEICTVAVKNTFSEKIGTGAARAGRCVRVNFNFLLQERIRLSKGALGLARAAG